MSINALDTPQGYGMGLRYKINMAIIEYRECGYDKVGLAKREVLKDRLATLEREYQQWRTDYDSALRSARRK